MSVIRSVAQQWEKAEYSHQLQTFFKQEDELNYLFIGATNSITVCNLIAAMVELPPRPQEKQYQVDIEQAFSSLFQCFILLFIKEAEHKSLTQAEQLVLSITLHFAKKIIQQPHHPEALINSAQKAVNAMEQLEIQRKQQRKANQNMGNN
ncbi:hypothetical protein [Shewanella maritima]|uniref:hypothetical protein n=1 Tax=Shewanella maritima TaxID=2520507 RepID=UPI00373696EC